MISKENLFEPDDADTLVKLIEKQLDNIENDSSKAKYKNLKQYSLQNVIKQMAEIYTEV